MRLLGQSRHIEHVATDLAGWLVRNQAERAVIPVRGVLAGKLRLVGASHLHPKQQRFEDVDLR
jgi:hypothetical protein